MYVAQDPIPEFGLDDAIELVTNVSRDPYVNDQTRKKYLFIQQFLFELQARRRIMRMSGMERTFEYAEEMREVDETRRKLYEGTYKDSATELY